jgi:hypothetical protein
MVTSNDIMHGGWEYSRRKDLIQHIGKSLGQIVDAAIYPPPSQQHNPASPITSEVPHILFFLVKTFQTEGKVKKVKLSYNRPWRSTGL